MGTRKEAHKYLLEFRKAILNDPTSFEEKSEIFILQPKFVGQFKREVYRAGKQLTNMDGNLSFTDYD